MENGFSKCVMGTACVLGLATGGLAAEKPNVLIILADDLGYGDTGCYGAELVKTPNIDRLAAQGVRFTDAHSPAAVCQPSRYGVMTGRYNWRRGKPWDGSYMFSDKHPTLQQVLGTAGYATAAFGKWHNGWGLGPIDYGDEQVAPGPLESGFGYYFGTPRSHNEPPQVFMENRTMYGRDPSDPLRIIQHSEVVERGLKDWGWGLSEGAAAAHAARPQDEIDLIVAERAADYLRERPKDEPFFLYVAFVAPHVPIAPSSRFQGTSQAGQYGDFLQQLDCSVGTVLDALEEKGLDKNTLVIFSSDNGAVYMHSAIEAGHHQNGPLLGQKTDAWCGGNQVPFIVRWPGKVPAGKTSDVFVSLTDIMATVTAATGVETPETAIDSQNQLPVFLSPMADSIRTEMIYTGIFGQGIYSGGWVYYPFQGSGGMTAHPTQRWGQPYSKMGVTNSDLSADGRLKADAAPAQLYNVNSDPGQTVNLYRQNPERATSMQKRLDEIIAPPVAPAGDGSTVMISPAAPAKAPVSWNAEIWGDSAKVPTVGNHYVHDNKNVWLLALGKNGSFPGESLTLRNDASVWLTGGGALGKGVLVLDGGQLQNRLGRKAVVLGRVRVDSTSKILNVEGSLELKPGLAGAGNLQIASFKNSGTVTVGCEDQGYSGTFILADSAADGAVLDVEFSGAFPQAGLDFQNLNSARMPALQLQGALSFSSVRMPAKNGGMIDLKPGTYDAAALKTAGVSEQAFKDFGGALTVGL
ncbi:sulfatase family protein [Tichowtungia aerotolerans]|uniref:Sulfatase-like hydrolase/transferase n=1 Tax=Tichowtungia aerotolerans TaxID=2697043 RepID=A0A6P1M4D7_9BACT|nr:arylsulfatase [Tichowtungia aerotolerans]QHI68707.1 sulfatase-like hydrolase/transferase [Tichowtungia aerotolerans]